MTTLAATNTAPAAPSAGIGERIVASVRARLARMRARYEYRQLLGCEDGLLRDAGTNRAEVRHTLCDF
ncbi:MAG: hypothetical protein U1E59_13050 [Amaricoccus sp.]